MRSDLLQAPDASAYVFIDWHNTYVPMRHKSADVDGVVSSRGARLHVEHLMMVALAGRRLAGGLVAGAPLPLPVRRHFRELGLQSRELDPATSGKEQGVDEVLQVDMLRLGADEAPGTLVLVSGDGAGLASGRGFSADALRLARQGWLIEVMAWEASTSRHLRDLAHVYIPLDRYFHSITFIEGGRRASLPALMHRPVARRSSGGNAA